MATSLLSVIFQQILPNHLVLGSWKLPAKASNRKQLWLAMDRNYGAQASLARS